MADFGWKCDGTGTQWRQSSVQIGQQTQTRYLSKRCGGCQKCRRCAGCGGNGFLMVGRDEEACRICQGRGWA